MSEKKDKDINLSFNYPKFKMFKYSFMIIYMILFSTVLLFIYQCGDNFCQTCTVSKIFEIENSNRLLILVAIDGFVFSIGLLVCFLASIEQIKTNIQFILGLKFFVVLMWAFLFFSLNKECGPIPTFIFLKELLWK